MAPWVLSALLAGVFVAGVALAALFLYGLHHRGNVLVRLHIDGREESFEGVMVGQPNGRYRLKNAHYVAAEGVSTPLEGEALVPAERVLFVQVLR